LRCLCGLRLGLGLGPGHVVGDDDLRVHAEQFGVVVDDLHGVDLVPHFGPDLHQGVDRAEQSVGAGSGHRALSLGQGADELDVEFDALDFGRRRRQDACVRHPIERDVDQRRQQFVVQALEHRPEHQQPLFVALGDLGRGDVRPRVVGHHQEQVGVVRRPDPLASVLDVGQQVVQAQVDVIGRAHTAARACGVDVHHAARHAVGGLVLVLRRDLQGRIDLVVDRLAFAQLLML
jgi:hypothetical protein